MPPTVPQSLYPLYAPLPIPIFEHLLVRLQRKLHIPDVQLWDILIQEVAQKRQTVFYYMDPFVRLEQEKNTPRITTGWLLETLSIYSPESRPVPRPTLSYWARTGRVRYAKEGRPVPGSAAALLIARLIDTGERNFLPDSISEQEPAWWCTAETPSPDKHIFSHPAPHVEDLAPATVLWTQWAGAAWDQDWIQIRDSKGYAVGAIRFAGISVQGNSRRWQVTLEDIRSWAPDVAALAFSQDEDVVQLLATLTLRRLAVSRIGTTNVDLP